MPSLKEVRNRITSIQSTQQITKAMKMVSAAKLRRAQTAIVQLRPYAQKLQQILSNLESGIENELLQAYSTEREVNKVLIVVLTSDRGLCGGFNSATLKGATLHVEEKYPAQLANGGVTFLTIGKKGFEYFSKRDFTVIGKHTTLFHDQSFDKVRAVGEEIMAEFVEGKYDKVELVYNEFKNAATQILKVEQFLPIQQTVKEVTTNTDYIFEPNQEEILTALVPKSLKVQIFKAVLDSFASEQGARMTAMEKATDNAGALLKELKLSYNRSRQAAITNEILEIVGGAEALKG